MRRSVTVAVVGWLTLSTCAFAQTPSIVGTSSASISNSTTFSLSVPAQTIAGDFLIVGLALNNEGFNNANTTTGPAGWTHYGQVAASGNVANLDVWYKFFSAGDPLSNVWSFAPDRQDVVGGMVAVAGIDTNVPFDISVSNSGTTGTIASLPGFNAAYANELLLGFSADNANSAISNVTAGYTQLWNVLVPAYSGGAAFSRILANAGPTGTFQGTVWSGSDWAVELIGLKPANSGPPPTPTPTPTSLSTSTPTSSPSATPTPTSGMPLFGHVFVVLEENTSYSSVVGNTAQMPFLNSLISSGGLATNYYANTHPSLPNYLWLGSGSNDGITTDTCGENPPTPSLPNDNIIRYFIANNVSWRTYQESLPATGYMGCDFTGAYDPDHNPFRDFSDVQNSTSQQQNITPFSQFAADLANANFVQYTFIVPNNLDNGHSGTLATADQWLQTNVGPLLNTSMFQPGGDGMLIVTWDESDATDTTNGGGHTAWVVVSPKAKVAYKSTTFYQHPSTLRTVMEALGLSNFPQAAATAPDMSEFFLSNSSPTPTASATSSVTPTATGTSTATPTAIVTPTPTATITATATLVATATPTPTATATATPTAAATPTATATPHLRAMAGMEIGSLAEFYTTHGAASIDSTHANAPGGAWSLRSQLASDSSGLLYSPSWVFTTPRVSFGLYLDSSLRAGSGTQRCEVMSFLDGATFKPFSRIYLWVDTNGVCQLQAVEDQTGTWIGTPVAVPTNTWLEIQFGINLGNPGTSEFYINGVLAGRASNLNLTLAGSSVGLVIAGNDQTSNPGATGSFYIDDIALDDTSYPDYHGRIIARQIQPGTPTYDAFAKVGGTAISDVWSDTPYNSATFATSSTSQAAQTGLLASLSATEGTRGTGTVQAGDTINAVKHAVVAKTSNSSGAACSIRRRINGNDLDFPITLGTSDSYYETPLETDADARNLNYLNSSEVGLVHGANTFTQTVEDAWAIVYYTAGGATATATPTVTLTPTPAPTGTATATSTATPTATSTATAGQTASATPTPTATLTATATPTPTPTVSLSPTSLTFSTQRVGTTSPPKTITMKNTGNATLLISGIAASGDFAQTNGCGSSLVSGGTCTISVTFTPTVRGTRTGAITISDNAADSPQTVTLIGKGR